MRRLILLRHGKTVPSVPAGDHARPLSPRGIAEASLAGRHVSRLAPPDHALVSDARRTRETFDRVVEAAGREMPHRFEPRLYGAPADDILARIAESPDGVETLLVIGHNPGVGDLARRLARGPAGPGREDLAARFPTSAFAVITLAAPDWNGAGDGGTLDHFVTPGDG